MVLCVSHSTDHAAGNGERYDGTNRSKNEVRERNDGAVRKRNVMWAKCKGKNAKSPLV
jgi:hypothetical protein